MSQNENELINREVLGGSPGGRSTSSAGGALISTFSTGRLRSSDHDAVKVPGGGDPLAGGPYPYETKEYSAFGNIVVTVPGTVLGGQVKISGFIGENSVFLRLKSDAAHALDADQSGKARNESLIAGATALWAQQNTYALATIVGTLGQSTLKDSVDDCYGNPPYDHDFCHHNQYNFNTAGFIGTVTAGHVFDLAGKAGPKLDLRGSVSYVHNVGDRFTNVFTDQQKYTLSTWTGTATATLFANITLQDNALLRPYIAGYVRQEWGYKNELEAIQSDGTPLGNLHYGQEHLYGGVDAGLTYTQGNTTFGAAIYYEASGDERTLGGRLGMSQKLDGVAAAAQKAKGFTWTGFYVGANAGKTWAESRTDTTVACLDFAFPPDNTFNCKFTSPDELPAGPSTSSEPINAAGTGKLSDSGFSGGAQAGYNLQMGGLVFGLEVDAGSFKLGASRSVAAAGELVTTSFDTDWLFTARTRLGLPVGSSLLVYGTSGFALTSLGVGNSVTSIGAASTHGLVTGFTFGGGAELALSHNWTLRGEYLHLDFGRVTVNTPTTAPGNVDFNTARTTADLTAQMVRLGLNYKF